MKKIFFFFALVLICVQNIVAQTTAIPDPNFEQALIDLGYDSIIDGSVTTSNINTVEVLGLDFKNIFDLTGIQDFDSLKLLACDGNNLTSLDVSQNSVLERLYCNDNNISQLDLSFNPNLTTLLCSLNVITKLDVSNNLLLNEFACNMNNLSCLNVNNNNNLNFIHFEANNNPDLTCIQVDDPQWADSNWVNWVDPSVIFNSYCSPCNSISGRVYYDFNTNCLNDYEEEGISDISLVINPINLIVQTDANGYWYVDSLPNGTYTITVDTLTSWVANCIITDTFTIMNQTSQGSAPSIGMLNSSPCSRGNVSIYAPFLRRCFSNQIIFVKASNHPNATDTINSPYIDVILDSMITVDSSSYAYTNLGNDTYRFQINNLPPGHIEEFTLSTTISCSTMLSQTLCMEAYLFPIDSCSLDDSSTPSPMPPGSGPEPCTLPWDKSSLSVEGWCANDSIYFTITNTGELGNGDMDCFSPVRVYIDGVLTYTDSIQLLGAETVTYVYPGTGETWILQADQHPLHPGNSHPNAHVEACGDTLNWTPGLVNDLPLNDADPIVDIYCGVVSGSYDPNDKRGFPNGVGQDHIILPNQSIEYMIRFQNTGTDTAFTVVIRDTLDFDLDIFSVTSGVSSHDYTFKMYGPRVLEWTFNNIMLPDSFVDEPGSNGFVVFQVKQNPNLSDGTIINNSAAIYFDFNDPIITNQTLHTINRGLNFLTSVREVKTTYGLVKMYPNPTDGLLYISLDEEGVNQEYMIFDAFGKLVMSGNLKDKISKINLNDLVNGVYFISIGNGLQYNKIIKF